MERTRRKFLGAAAGAAVGLNTMRAANPDLLPQVPFGDHKISRLIVGTNQFYGYSHFNSILSELMKEWFTPERVAETLGRATDCGVNTWQTGAGGRSLSDLELLRSRGGDIKVISLVGSEFEQAVAQTQPIGIAHHGEQTDVAFREGKMETIHEFLRRARQTGSQIGVSTHKPEVVAYIEEKGWDLDFYMTCAYNRTRTSEEFRKLLGGELPIPPKEIYLEEDPERMCHVVRQTRRTCLVFKILAAGRLTNSPRLLDSAFQNILTNIKPQDCVIVGTFPRFKDEMQDNAERVRRILSELS
jgi:hypothetical protein